MNLAVYEWRKLFRLPALWAFLALCLAFNGLLIASLSPYDRAFFNETSRTAKALGQRVDEDFLAGLDAMPATENRDLLLQSVTGMEDIFETYDAGELSDFYAGVVEKSPTAGKWMTWKYGLLADRVAHLAETDAAMDLYAGPVTYGSHQFLFGSLFRAVLCESAILAMLGTLYLLGYEGMHRTEGLACSSRMGRKLRLVKVLAALPASAALYGLLAVCTLVPYFLLYDYGGIWDASVSSQFNYFSDMLVVRPFLTWGDFTVAQYLAAALALWAVLAAVNITVYAVPFLAQGPLRFAACSLGGIWEWGTPWFDWTYGTYLLVLAGLLLALSLGAAGLTVFLSQYSGNYIAMLLKAVPLFVAVGAVLGTWLLDMPFMFRNLGNGALWLPRGIEAVTAGVLLALGLGLCLLACRRQRRRELQ